MIFFLPLHEFFRDEQGENCKKTEGVIGYIKRVTRNYSAQVSGTVQKRYLTGLNCWSWLRRSCHGFSEKC